MLDFNKIDCFIYEEDGLKAKPVFVTKSDGPHKGELLFMLNEGRLEIAEELVKRFNK